MASRVGNLVNIWVAKEATRGTAATTGGFWIAKSTLTETSEITKSKLAGTYNNIYSSAGDRNIARLERISFEFQVTPSNVGIFLVALTGTTPTTTGSTLYEHTFTEDLDSNTHQSLTIAIENLESGTPKVLELCMLETLTLNQTAGTGGGFLTATATFVGRISASTTVPVLSYSATELPFAPRHLNLKYDDEGGSAVSGTAFCPRDFSLTFSKTVLADFGFCGSNNAREHFNQSNEVTGNFNITWNDTETDFRDAFEADQAHKTFRFSWSDTDTTIGAGHPQILFVTEKTSVTGRQTNIPNTEIISAQVDFSTYHRRTTGKAFASILLKNDVASY